MASSADAIEQAILHGIDAKPSSSYREDRRADSPVGDDALNTDDELGSDLPDDNGNDAEDHDLYHRDDLDDDELGAGSSSAAKPTDVSNPASFKGLLSSKTQTSGGKGASNTGPKGVLRDQRSRAQQDHVARIAAIHSTNQRMEKLAFSSETYAEQMDREKREAAARLRAENRDSDDEPHADDDNELEGVSRSAIADLRAKEKRREMRIAELKAFHHTKQQALLSGSQPPTQLAIPRSTQMTTGGGVGGGSGAAADRWFGHLREVDERGYVSAIDSEDPHVSVVIHIYSKAVEECNILTHTLASLARQYPRTKFLQVQAAAIGFGRSNSSPRLNNEDDDEEEVEEEYDELNPRTLEVLPTLLVYRAGTLVANLVRVDLDDRWKRGSEQNIRDILADYNALGPAHGSSPAPVLGGLDHEDDD
ncbi:thioredoxin-like protein [Testicularia cyperi]|uniref:Thioredoxin-like protein n=1 Tax=Testicularia cyperi TaxID=1882483 RepID=A0A317XW34_9BASI|nr:thioredoxin-like protein [Testicularia cyperi]